MLNKYFKFKVKTKDFIDNLEDIIEKLKNKKVLICGGEEGFIELDKLFNLSKKLDIIAFAKTNKQTGKVIEPEDIKNENFDSIIITDDNSEKIYNLLFYRLGLEKEDIKILFKEDIEQGRENLIYLLKHNFDKTLPKLIKKLKNKKIILYGAGIFFEVIDKYFDLSRLNIVAISDMKFRDTHEQDEFLGYKTCKSMHVDTMNVDYIIVTTKLFYNTWEHLYFDFLENSKKKIKIIPMVHKNILEKILELADK